MLHLALLTLKNNNKKNITFFYLAIIKLCKLQTFCYFKWTFRSIKQEARLRYEKRLLEIITTSLLKWLWMQAAIKITILYLSFYDINTDILVFICSIISAETFPGEKEKERQFFLDWRTHFLRYKDVSRYVKTKRALSYKEAIYYT